MAATDPYSSNVAVVEALRPEGAQMMPSKSPEPPTKVTSETDAEKASKLASPGGNLTPSTISHDSKVMRFGRRTRPSIQVMNFDGPCEDENDSFITTKPASKPAPAGLFSTSANSLGPAFGASGGMAVKAAAPSGSVIGGGLSPAGIDIVRSVTPQDKIAYGQSIDRANSAQSFTSSSSSSSDDSTPGDPADVFSVASDFNSPETEAPTPGGTMRRKKPAAVLTYGGRSRKSHRIPALFTKVMDRHLWNCLLKDMALVTNAPYRMRDGQPPPTGVQLRVAEDAKKTWRDNDTPAWARVGWPSGKDTRVRLRQLCRDMPHLTTSDLRRVRACSPTPEQAALNQLQARQGQRDQRRKRAEAYDMRNVRVSLFSQSAHSMRPGGPLNQLHTHPDAFFRSLGSWMDNYDPFPDSQFRAVLQAAVPQPGGQPAVFRPMGPPPLGTPFIHQSRTWTSGMGNQLHSPTIAQPRPHRPFATVNRLDPAINLEDGERQRSSNKRPAPFSTEDASRRDREHSQSPLARPSGEETAAPRRVRPRGLTLEDVFVRRPQDHGLGGDGANSMGAPSASTMPAAPPMYGRGLSGDRVLRSPFDGITSRPTRARAIPRPAAALTIFPDPEATASIDEVISGQSASAVDTTASNASKSLELVDGLDEGDLAMDTSQ